MKNYLFLIVIAQMLFACSHKNEIIKTTQNIDPLNLISFEERMRSQLDGVWNEYLVEDFSDSKALEIAVITNRWTKGKFDCMPESFTSSIGYGISIGFCKINAPKNRMIGSININDNGEKSSHEFFKIISSKSSNYQEILKAVKDSKYNPLIFVHGFNVNYSEALTRAAQIAYDLKYQGQVILFTWPAGSKEGIGNKIMIDQVYQDNRKNAQSSVKRFEDLIKQIKETGKKPNIIVHSMGHQIVLPALQSLTKISMDKENFDNKNVIDNLILNAPDFDSKEFSHILPNISKLAKNITLYCSYNDKAIMASKNFNNSERLGSCAFLPGIDVINVGLVDDSSFGLGHGYYSSRAVLTDVFQMLLGIKADKRLFVFRSEPNSKENYFLRR